MSKFDAIVIGGGHNGLVCAAYLARAGKKVCVLERRHVLGGCATTEELWPGYKVSTAAYVISLFLPQIIRELKLKEYGLTILPRSPSSFTPLPDGRSLLLGADADLCRREISKFSTTDADGLSALQRVSRARRRRCSSRCSARRRPIRCRCPKTGATSASASGFATARSCGRCTARSASLGADLPQAVELLTGAARPILDRWFESDVLKATLATDAIIGAFLSISSPGSAYVLLHHVMGEAGGARGVWGYVQGGMGGLATSLAGACSDLGVEIRRESPVQHILTDRGRAVGVRLEDGTQIDAKIVASSVDAHLTFEKFLTPDELPEYFREAVARIDYSSASAKINLALAEPPRFTCMPDDGVGPHHHGTMHIGPSLDYLERAYDDAKYGRPSERPILEMTMATSVDRTIAPPGKHLLSMFVQYAPYKLAEGKLGRHQRNVRRPLHRSAGRVRAERAQRDRAPPGPLAARPGAHVRHHRRQHHARRDERRTNCSASARSPAGPTTARRSAACICAAPPATPAAASSAPAAKTPPKKSCGTIDSPRRHGEHRERH